MAPKYISVKEFRELGYLQELNRQFLHPLGLALEVFIDDDGNESLGNIWDYREDAEGICYDLKNSNDARRSAFLEKYNHIKSEMLKRAEIRVKKFGGIIEPITNH